MKRLLLSLLLAALLIAPTLQVGTAAAAAAPSPYSENLNVYLAGQNGLWFLTLHGINATSAALSSIESQSGLNSYSLAAVKSTGAVSDFQVFGRAGYNVFGLPFLPGQGLFLTIDSSNASLAGLVGKFDAYLQADFQPLSSSGTVHTYFSPADFAVVAPKLFGFYPQGLGGLASLFTLQQFEAFPTPIIRLGAQAGPSGFDHTLTLGSAVQSVVDSSGNLLVGSLLRLKNGTLEASPASSGSQVTVRALDGLIGSSDAAVLRNALSNFTGYYSLPLPPGTKVKPNVTEVTDAPIAVGTRILDTGSLNQGSFLSVTLQVHNAGTRGAVENLAVNDSWWKAYPQLFQLSSGNDSLRFASLPPGQNVSATYVLKVISPQAQDVVIPSLSAPYQFSVGNESFAGSVLFNQAEVRTNEVGPAISITATTSVRPGSPLGTPGRFLVTVKNIGNGPALDLKLLNSSLPSLTQDGGTWSVNSTIPLTGITTRNVSRVFSVQWTTPDGETGQLSSNRATALYSSTGMLIPFVKVAASSSFVPGRSPAAANVTYAFENAGGSNATDASATVALPQGLTCSNVTGGGACAGSVVTLHPRLGASVSSVTVALKIDHPDNFVIMPLNVTTAYGGLSFHSYSSAVVLPAGLSVTKVFSPDPVFEGMNAAVTVTVRNAGSTPVYNATVVASADSFDAVRTGVSSTTQSYVTQLNPSASNSFNYSVTVGGGASGNRSLSGVTVSFLSAGTPSSLTFPTGAVQVYPPLSAAVTTVPAAPVEGTTFSARIVITNPSPVPVSDVRLSLPIPAGLTVVNATGGATAVGHSLAVTLPQVGADSNRSVVVSLRAAGGLDFNITEASLTFSYASTSVPGSVPKQVITVNENVLTRYTEPIIIALLLMLATLVVIRRRVASSSSATSPSSPPGTPQKPA